MSWNNKIVWSEGLFLRPQHFQQQDRYHEQYVEQRAGRLRSYPWGFTELKIDHRMLAGAARQAPVRAALKKGLDLARELNLKAVAEGIETREEWELINELGCDMAQGYFIARPMPADELVAWKESWSSDPFL